MKKLITYYLLLLASVSASAQVPQRWETDVARPAPAQFTRYDGDAITFEPVWLAYGAPLATNGMTFTLYWQTNGMGKVWFTNTAGSAFQWLPEYYTGASQYTFFIGADGYNYQANGVLRVLPSPGRKPNTMKPPIPYLDFLATPHVNAPWLYPWQVVAGENVTVALVGTNVVISATGGGGGNVDTSAFVPYTGAVKDVDLGAKSLAAGSVRVVEGGGIAGIVGQSASYGLSGIDFDMGSIIVLGVPNKWKIVYPQADGTLALKSQIPTLAQTTPLGSVQDVTGKTADVIMDSISRPVYRFKSADASVTVALGFYFPGINPDKFVFDGGTRKRFEVWLELTGQASPRSVKWVWGNPAFGEPFDLIWEDGEPVIAEPGEYRFEMWSRDGWTVYARQVFPSPLATQGYVDAAVPRPRPLAYSAWRSTAATVGILSGTHTFSPTVSRLSLPAGINPALWNAAVYGSAEGITFGVVVAAMQANLSNVRNLLNSGSLYMVSLSDYVKLLGDMNMNYATPNELAASKYAVGVPFSIGPVEPVGASGSRFDMRLAKPGAIDPGQDYIFMLIFPAGSSVTGGDAVYTWFY